MQGGQSGNLQWKVNVILGGDPNAKVALPENKAIRRLLKGLQKLDDSVFEKYIEYRKNKQLQAAQKKEEEGEKRQVLLDRVTKELTERNIKDTIENIRDIAENIVNAITDVILFKEAKKDREQLRDNPDLKTKIFQNWGGTFKTQYQQILYPDEFATDRQVGKISDFVKNNSQKGSRTRGAGIRHSWGSVFSDPNNYLVSFYPYTVATGTSFELQAYAKNMLEKDKSIEASDPVKKHLGMIRVVGQSGSKTLVRIGAGVSNEQMRRWCIEKGYQYKSNVIMVEVNVCGGIGTCSHGAGIDTQTLCDYLYEVQFIDYTGKLHTVNKDTHPHQMLSVASSMGLLGLMVYVTIEMEPLEIVQFLPRQSYKDFVIPTPKGYTKTEERKNRPEYKQWLQDHDQTPLELDWDQNFKKFKAAIHKTYCEWFYFPIEGVDVFENVWDKFGVKSQAEIDRIKEVNPKGVFINEYPPPAIKFLSEFSLFVGGKLVNNEQTQSTIERFMKYPFAFFPNENRYVNYPDAVHFQRGIQNMQCRDFQVEINVPLVKNQRGEAEMDYDLIQRLWWSALEIVEEYKDTVNVALQMRMFRGSKATLAPEIGYEYVCSIEILRSLTFSAEQESKWTEVVMKVFNAWKSEKDGNGKFVKIRPHWGKEWNMYPEVKEHTFNDTALLSSVFKFMHDYGIITEKLGIDKAKNLKAFSNQIYRELIKKATGYDIQ